MQSTPGLVQNDLWSTHESFLYGMLFNYILSSPDPFHPIPRILIFRSQRLSHVSTEALPPSPFSRRSLPTPGATWPHSLVEYQFHLLIKFS